MSVWLLASLALLAPFAAAALLACRGGTSSRFIAAQLAAALAVPVLILLTYAFDQSAFVDLPLALALLTLPGAMLTALFLERWL